MIFVFYVYDDFFLSKQCISNEVSFWFGKSYGMIILEYG